MAIFLCECGLPSTSIHGDRLEEQRREVMEEYRTGVYSIIVGTRLAAAAVTADSTVFVWNMPKSIKELLSIIGKSFLLSCLHFFVVVLLL